MIRLLLALCVYQWHRRVKRCPDVEALRFKGYYTRIQCRSCATHIWQREGLFSGRR